jgi:predicted ATPase/class 3 adenylate cyclase
MTFEEILDHAVAMLQRRGRVTYRTLQLHFQLEDETLEALKEEILYSQPQVVDDAGKGLVWTGAAKTQSEPTSTHPAQPEVTQQDHPTLAEPPSTEQRSPDAERRQLTVLFCDLVDSTVLSRRLDPEYYREVVRAYQATCADIIQRFDGHIAQYLGDGLLVYFGYPQAHEDDAQRAIRTGLGILEAMGTLNVRLVQDKGVRLAVRVGIHTGLVVVGEMGSGDRHEHLALGDTPNLAARLQGLAAPGTVVISEATSRLVQGYFMCQDLGSHALKGVDTPVQVYQVLGESAAQSRLDVAGATGLTPLVGREHEVGLLLERWAQSTNGHGQVVLLSGEAGIGKSRLVHVLTERVVDAHTPRLTLRCSPYHTNSALYPVIEHLQRVLHWHRDAPPETRLAALEQALQVAHLPLAEVVPLVAALLSLPVLERYSPLTLSPQRQKQKTQEALVAWLLAEAAQQPVLAIWEDLHWADPSTLELLGLLLDQAPTARLLLVLTARPEFRPPWAPRSYVTPLSLTRLTRHQIEEMVRRVTGGKPLPAAVVQQIVAKTDGIPLFVEELVKTILESGLVREEEGHYVLTGPLPPLAIPATLQDALMARLDRLAGVKDVAQLGAVLGREFPYELLRTVAPIDETTLQHGLAQLVEAELLYQRGIPPQATYVLKHALVQDAAYQSLLRSTRQQYHQRIAQVLAAQFPETAETQPELLAHHATEAGLAAQAVGYWQQAGERSNGRSAYVEAVVHCTKGLEVLQTLPDTPARTRRELEIQLTLGQALAVTKGAGAPEVGHAIARARELCLQVGDASQFLRALGGLGRFYRERGELQIGRELLEQHLALAQRQHDAVRLMEAHGSMGVHLYFLGEFVPARAHLEQALALAGSQQDRAQTFIAGEDTRVSWLGFVAFILWVLGYPDQALTRSHEMLTYAQGLSHAYSLSRALSHAGTLHRLRREWSTAQERAEAALAIRTEQELGRSMGVLTLDRGAALVAQGQGEAGMAQMHEGLAAIRATGQGLGLSVHLTRLAEACGKSGQAEAGLRLLAEALVHVDHTGERYYEAEVYRRKGELLLQQAIPDAPQAEVCFQQALAVARRQEAKSLELRAATSLSRLWQQQGKRQEARDLLAPIYGWFTEGFDTADLKDAKMLLDELT